MDTDRLCMGCMKEKEDVTVCPFCGYDEGGPISPIILSPRTILMNGHYLIGRVLGKPGGFGITYLAWDIKLETKVAIKEFLPKDLVGRDTDHTTVVPHHSDDKDLFEYGLERFIQEARTLARFDHPNVVRVKTFFEENGTAYLVMNYYEGVPLDQYLKDKGGRLDEKLAIDIMMPIMDGLREVHEKGFLHRDIKPQNIYLTEGGVPILLDFGAARFAMGERSKSLSVVITPGFAPFEQYQRKGNQGVWTDIYSCGATLYYMLTGEEPPAASDRVTDDELVKTGKLVKGISPHMRDALLKALAMKIEKRPRRVREFQNMLMGKDFKEKEHDEKPKIKEFKFEAQPVSTRKKINAPMIVGLVSVVLMAFIVFMLVNKNEKTGKNYSPPPPGKPADASDIFNERLQTKAKRIYKNKQGYWEAEFDNKIEMVYIPPGSFIMGSEGGYEDEKPEHNVNLDGYWIGKYEVTYEQFKRFIDSTGYETDAETNENAYVFDGDEWEEDEYSTWEESEYFDEELEDHPVVCVSWNDCVFYTTWLSNKTGLNFRLPTEAEWEKAARGTDGRKYPWGDAFAALPQSQVKGRSIHGKVFLEDGSMVPGVIITLYDDKGKIVRRSISNETGAFRFTELSSLNNNYSVKAELEGFKTLIYKNVQVKDGFISKLDLMLETTTLREEITVFLQSTEFAENVPGSRANFADFQFADEFEKSWANKGVDDGYFVSSPVGSNPYGASPHGVMDMAGNVWEWCLDWYTRGYYKSSPANNPKGPGFSSNRVIRGGGWNSNVDEIRAAKRDSKPPSFNSDFLGFRLVMTEK